MKNPPTPNLSDVASTALGWIASVGERLADRDTPQLLQAYAVAALCGDIEPGLQSEVKKELGRIRAKINSRLEKEIARCDGTTVLLCCLLEHNRREELLLALKDYAGTAASALNELPLSVVAKDYGAAKMLLAGLGLSSGPFPSTLIFEPDLSSLLMGDEKTTRGLAARLESITSYGTHSLETSKGLDTIIECLMMEAIRVYNIELAGRLLRALLYLGKKGGLAIRTALHFIRTSQNAEGSFGFFDEAVKKLRVEGPEPYASLRIYLPVALSCLWTVAEANLENYRMFRDLGKSAELSGGQTGGLI